VEGMCEGMCREVCEGMWREVCEGMCREVCEGMCREVCVRKCMDALHQFVQWKPMYTNSSRSVAICSMEAYVYQF
jgi:hypothetical protein